MDAEARNRNRVKLIQRYLLNPPVKAAVMLGLVPGHAVIETVGRKTGKRRRTVIGYHPEGKSLWVVAEQGRHAGYVRNLEADPELRVRLRGRWRRGRAAIVEDDDPQGRLDSFGRRGHARVVRSFGTSLLSIRIDLQD
jgi:deazaflavin-dependent oxidoreductase (nitroreductase family)